MARHPDHDGGRPAISRLRPRSLTVALAALLLVLAAIVVAVQQHEEDHRGPRAQPLAGTPLRTLARRAGGRLIGTAVDDGALRHEPGYRADLAGQFSSVTPENVLKWALLEPTRGKVDWSGADRLVAFARRHDMAIRGHTLVWWDQLPAWVQALKGNAARQAMHAHIRAVLHRYRRTIRTWDVVNEPFADDGRRHASVWQSQLGDGWVQDALRTARAADPTGSLWINEFDAEAIGPKSDALYALVKDLKARGVPLDGVGFQAHLTLHGLPPTALANLRRFAALGVDVAFTEVDVALADGDPASDALRRQAGVYGDVARTCLAVSRCRGLTVWGFTDEHSWIPGTQPGNGRADLLDGRLRAKPAFGALQRELAAGRG